MVPVYAITAWLTFRYFQYALYFEMARGLVESMVIHEFFNLVLKYVGETDQEVAKVLQDMPPRPLPFPFGRWQFSPASPHFVMDLRVGVMQYALLRPLVTVIALILSFNHLYCPNSMSVRHGKFWCTIILMASTALAMYTLVLLYLTVKHQIHQHQPVTKFISVKFVLFMSFWQSIIIGVLVHFHLIHDTHHWTSDNLATGLQSFCVVVEMFIASLLHMRNACFGYQPFAKSTVDGVSTASAVTPPLASLADAYDPR